MDYQLNSARLMPDTPEFLTVEEAAALLRIGRTSAYALAKEWRETGGQRVTIPDIMAALESDTGRTSGRLYKQWFDEHAGPLFGLVGRLREESDPRVREIMEHQLEQESYCPPISGHQCWLFRCAVLHQARGRQDETETTRLAFIEPGSTTASVHMVGVKDGSGHTVLQLDLGEFCRTMVQAAVEWLDANRENRAVRANLAEVLTVYPDGAGGISGVPVVM